MYLIEYVNSGIDSKNDLLLEGFGSPQQQINNDDQNSTNNKQDPNQQQVSQETIEFENIKKFLLYGKIKELRSKLEESEYYNKKDIIKLKEFLDLILVFFNTFSYHQLNVLINDIVDTINAKLKI